MTVTLKQISQLTGITAFSNFVNSGRGDAIVLSPTTPALVFDYGESNTYPYVGVIIGTTTQQQIYSGQGVAGLYANNVPPIWFLNAFLSGGSTCQNTQCNTSANPANCVPFYIYYNITNVSFNYNCNIQPTVGNPVSLNDISIDFQRQVVYLFYLASPFSYAIVYAISFNNLSTLIINQSFPTSYTVAYVTPPNAPGGLSFISSSMIYYNNTFYFNVYDGSGNYYIYVVPYSSITWSSTLPSSPQSIGALYLFWASGNVTIPIGSIFLNYIGYGSTLNAEILIYAVTGWNSTNRYYTSIAIFSFNLANNSATLLYSLTNANAPGRAINMGGVIAFAQFISGSPGAFTVAVGVYDRNLNTYQQSPSISNVLDLKVAQPGFAIIFTGSPSNMTVTVYQILLDITPTVTNLSYSTGVLSGTIIDQTSGLPLASVTVYLIQLASEGDNWANGTIVAITTTDSNGNFSFAINQAGYYAVYAVP